MHDTLTALRAAGIRIWMLTGDKFSTALQIATACGLRNADDLLIAIEARLPPPPAVRRPWPTISPARAGR